MCECAFELERRHSYQRSSFATTKGRQRLQRPKVVQVQAVTEREAKRRREREGEVGRGKSKRDGKLDSVGWRVQTRVQSPFKS